MMVLLRLSAGLIVWAGGFCLIYALHGVGCANDWPARSVGGYGLHRLVLGAAWIALVALSIGIAVRIRRHPVGVLDRAAILTSWAGVASSVVTFTPILIVASCL